MADDDIVLRLRLAQVREFVADTVRARRAANQLTRDLNGRLHDAQGRFARDNDRASRSLWRFSLRIEGLGKALRKVFGSKMLAMVVAFTGAALGLLPVLANLSVAVKELAVGLAPLAGLLPGIAAGFGLVQLTAIAAGKGIVKALEPFKGDWEAIEASVGRTASKGIPGLARGFMRVNMPTVAKGMHDIAQSMNFVLRGVGKWVNSARGQSAIKKITMETAYAFRRLRQPVIDAAQAIGELAGRGADVGIRGLTDLMLKGVKAVDRWAEGLTRQDMVDSLDRLKQIYADLGGKLRMTRDAIQWLADHTEQIKKFSDILGVAGITLGLIGGGPLAVAAGAITLLANHWDRASRAFKSAVGPGGWITRVKDAFLNDPWIKKIRDGLREIADLVKGDFKSTWNDLLLPGLKKAGHYARIAWAVIGPKLAELFKNKDFQNGVRAIAIGFAAVATAVIAIGVATSAMSAVFIATLGAAVAWFTGTFVRRFLEGSVVILSMLGSLLHGAAEAARAVGMDGLADQLDGAARNVIGFRDEANSALAGIMDRNVLIRFGADYSAVSGDQGSLFRAPLPSTIAAPRNGFSTGGYTGTGGKFEPAGIVHRNEFVIPSEKVNEIGVGNLAAMAGLPGYAAGGLVLPKGSGVIPKQRQVGRVATVSGQGDERVTVIQIDGREVARAVHRAQDKMAARR